MTRGPLADAERLLAFRAMPSLEARPEALGALFPELPDLPWPDLARSPRLAVRLAHEIRRAIGVAPDDPLPEAEAQPGTDLALALASPSELAQMATTAGAVWHAQILAKVVERAPRAALVEALGAERLRSAMALRDLGVTGRPFEDVDELLAAIDGDGRACLWAWALSLTPVLGARVRLKLEPASLRDSHVERGPAIVRAVAAHGR